MVTTRSMARAAAAAEAARAAWKAEGAAWWAKLEKMKAEVETEEAAKKIAEEKEQKVKEANLELTLERLQGGIQSSKKQRDRLSVFLSNEYQDSKRKCFSSFAVEDMDDSFGNYSQLDEHGRQMGQTQDVQGVKQDSPEWMPLIQKIFRNA